MGRSLSWAMSKILPGPEETWLLRALLHRGDSGRRAWAAFQARVPDLPALFRTDTGGRNRLAPLLLVSLRENRIDAARPLLTALRTAYLREELRTRVYFRIAGEVLDRLGQRGIPFLVLKGGALATTAYAEPCLRHAHDLDLLVAEGTVHEAAQALEGLGFTPPRNLTGGWGLTCGHTSGLPVLLLSRLFRQSYYSADLEQLQRHARGVSIGGRKARIPSPADNLIHALGHASYSPSRSTLLWATDSWMILRTQEGVDWDRALAATREARLEIPIFAQLRYLRRELGAPMPQDTLKLFGKLASRQDPMRRDMALSGARRLRGRPPGLNRWKGGGLKGRLVVLLWELFPSREYLRRVHGENWQALYPLLYLTRPVTVMADRLKWLLFRLLSVR